MVCPKCKTGESQVLDSRDGPDSVRRRRECLSCKYRFTTHERVEIPVVIVKKKNGDKEKFEPEKIRRGIRTSCKNRPVTTAQIDDLVSQASEQIYHSGKEEVSSAEIGHIVQELLKNTDQVAYLRFTSVYQSFPDLKAFEKAIHSIH